MTTLFRFSNGEACGEVDLEAFADAVERDHPGADPVPIIEHGVAERLGLADASAVELGPISDAVMSGLRSGSFPTEVTLGCSMKLRRKKSGPANSGTPIYIEGFDLAVYLPNDASTARFDALAGLDVHKSDLLAVARELRDPGALDRWASKHHGHERLPILDRLKQRVPLIVLAGDVGTGKTEMAETFGSVLGSECAEPTLLLRLGLAARGAGMQGQSTQRIEAAFRAARDQAIRQPVILLLDEADAIAQSREETQMHHEDRAAVNALIQAVDHLRELNGRLIVVMCTNRSRALDPALLRRAALVLRFERPDVRGLAAILKSTLGDLLTESETREIAAAAGPGDTRIGFTASDLVSRAIPRALRLAFVADQPLDAATLLDAVCTTEPTARFRDE